MKKYLFIIAFALIGLSANVFGQTFTYNGINYNVTNTSPNEVEVGENYGYAGAAVIPDSVQNGGVWYSVTAIGEYAFINCSGLTSVAIPNSVTTIGYEAFYGCSGLISLTIPNSVTTIAEGAFGICSGLTSVTLGISVMTIGYNAFYGCSGLTAVIIPSSVMTIGDWAFSECSGLASINVDANNPNYSSNDGILYDKAQDTLIQCPAGKIGAVTILNSVTTIGIAAFYFCSGLTSVTIGNSVTTIGDVAFQYCSDLTSVTCKAVVPPSLREDSGDAFYSVSSNIPVYVPCYSLNAYQTSWTHFNNFQSLPTDTNFISSTICYGTTYTANGFNAST